MEGLKSEFYPVIKKSDEQEKQKTGFEVLTTPEIIVQEEKGAQLLSLLLKAENLEWGETETPLAQATTEYFKDNQVDSEILNTIKNFYKEGVDEETLYNLALTYECPERAGAVLEMMAKYKPHVKNPQEVYQKVLAALEGFDQTFSTSPLAEKLSAEIDKDKQAREKTLSEIKERIEKLITFFKPDSKTTKIRTISLMPSDPLAKINTGSAYVFGEELVLKTHIDNPDNLEHEFLHSIINPIIEKLSRQLTEEQKEKISELANEKLKQDYGEGYFSLLSEEFIRTYNDVFTKGKKPQSYEDFTQKILGINEEQFQDSLAQSESLKARCAELNITTIKDFQRKSQEYFERFEVNRLRDVIFTIYQEYSNRPNKEAENFERFVLAKLTIFSGLEQSSLSA